MRLQALDTVATQHKPELDATEPAAERELPVAVVNDGARVALLGAEVGLVSAYRARLFDIDNQPKPTYRRDIQSLGQIAPVSDEEEGFPVSPNS